MGVEISSEEAKAYAELEELARAAEEAIEAIVPAALKADIPDTVKLRILKWVERAETFRGLSYFLHPQPEWTGGDSQDPKNFRLTAPHIAGQVSHGGT